MLIMETGQETIPSTVRTSPDRKEEQMKKQILWITQTALGITLFVVLSLCLQVPVFENYYLCLGYLVVAVWCCSVGTASGTIVATAGVVLYCLLTGGMRGMPGWAAGNLLIGLFLGISFRITAKIHRPLISWIIWIGCVFLACALGILGIKSLTECMLYAQPFWVRVVKNSAAFAADVFVLLVGLPLCRVVNARRKGNEIGL